LYELLTGERLFVGESDFSTLEKVRNVEILPPSTYNRRIGDELERIVLKALSKDVDDRYQNAIDLHDDLQAFMYTAGEFYSRKDLAAWMKKIFAVEIEAESAKLEAYRQMSVPAASPPSGPPGRHPPGTAHPSPPPPPGRATGAMPPVRVTAPLGSGSARATGAMAAAQVVARGQGQQAGPDMDWDDEELATNIYDAPQDASDA